MPNPGKGKGKGSRRKRGGRGQQENVGVVNPGGRSASSTLSRQILGLKQTQRLTLGWWNSGSFSQTEGIYTESVAVLNNPYDPDPTLGGESAQGYAKWMAFYSKCFVIRARWRVDFANLLTTSGLAPAVAPNYVGATVTTNSSSLSSAINAVTAGLSQYKLLAQNPDTCRFEGVVDIGKFLNKPQVLDDPDLYSASGAGPSQVVCLHTWAANTSAAGTSLYAVLVEFDCIFTDPIPFA
jgi:hypothetical protein